jgi:predicted N-acetyltransferase YhbS
VLLVCADIDGDVVGSGIFTDVSVYGNSIYLYPVLAFCATIDGDVVGSGMLITLYGNSIPLFIQP